MFGKNLIFGSEQGGYRPVLVIQNTKTKLPTHVPLKQMTGLEKDSVVLLEQVRTVDKKRLNNYVGKLES